MLNALWSSCRLRLTRVITATPPSCLNRTWSRCVLIICSLNWSSGLRRWTVTPEPCSLTMKETGYWKFIWTAPIRRPPRTNHGHSGVTHLYWPEPQQPGLAFQNKNQELARFLTKTGHTFANENLAKNRTADLFTNAKDWMGMDGSL